MKVGEKIIAKFSVGFPDYVTEGRVYEIVEVTNLVHGNKSFQIINDKGKKSLPLTASFKPVQV